MSTIDMPCEQDVRIQRNPDYWARAQQLSAQMQAQGGSIRLEKKTSNLFRHRTDEKTQKIDVKEFNHVLSIDATRGIAEVEGMITFEDCVEATLKRGFMPAVVPELKTITVGGALTGIGIESSSFRYGLVHETIVEFDVLCADGSIVTCTRDNEHKDLFFAFANSYGTLGYALRVCIKLVPVKSFVKLKHQRFTDPDLFYTACRQACDNNRSGGEIDFVDASVFAADEMILTTGKMVAQAPYTSDYTYMKIYYRSIQNREEDFLTIKDYIWRWDTDWFWCSKVFGAQNPILRALMGRRYLNSKTYWKIMRAAKRNKLLRRIVGWFDKPNESVIQDVMIPIENAAEFFKFFTDKIGITPFWNCPVRAPNAEDNYTLFVYSKDRLMVNFGFWDTVSSEHPRGYYNKMLEQKVLQLGGIKSLYSDAYYTEQEFWNIFDKNSYNLLKKRYDPKYRLRDLYGKCVDKS